MRHSTHNHAENVQFRSSGIQDVVYHGIRFESGRTLVDTGPCGVGDRPSYLHHHNALEVGYCYSGYGIFMVGASVLNFGPGDVNIIEAGIPHIAKSSSRDGSLWRFMYIDPFGFASVFGRDESTRVAGLCNPSCKAILRRTDEPVISDLAREMFAESQSGREDSTACTHALLLALLCKAGRTGGGNESAYPTSADAPLKRIAPALSMIAAQYAEEISVAEMAAACCLSEPQLRRIFLSAVGRSPLAHLTKFRLEMALSLLSSSSLSIAEIAGRVGYASPSSFYRHFMSHFGKSPSHWRQGSGS